MKDFNHILQNIEPISLKEMDTVKLLDRTDTKFIFNADLLSEILKDIQGAYRVLTTKHGRINSYKTLYFDTYNLTSYLNHHNGKLNRIKVRFREYIDSGDVFFEIKLKNNKGKTIKSRLKNDGIEKTLTPNLKKFLEVNSFYKAKDVSPVLWNSYSRITLVHKVKKERVTLDLNISFNSFDQKSKKEIPHVIIAEVKQEKMSVNSDFIQLMKKRYIRQISISKYCMGTVFTNKNIKSNKFKENVLKINRLKN